MEAGTALGVTVEELDGVVLVELNDGKANALSTAKFEAIEAAIGVAAGRSKPVVLAGRDGFFSAGLDLRALRGGDPVEVQALQRAGDQLFDTMRSAPIPIVAACTGHALAGGAVLLMCCDLRLGLVGAYGIGLIEVAIGIPLPVSIFSLAEQRLTRRYLLRATVLAEKWGPGDAVDVGYLDRVVADDVVGAAREAARTLAALPAEAYAASKATFWSGTAAEG